MLHIKNASQYAELTVFETGKEDCIKSKAISLTKKPYHLFHYVVNGKGTLILNGKEYNISKNSIFFIPRETDAIYFTNKDNPWSYEWIGFDGSKADEILTELEIDINNPVIVDNNKVFKECFDRIMNHYTTNGILNIYAIGCLYQLFGEMLAKKGNTEALPSTKVTIELAKEYINNNYQFDISIIDVSKNANVTANYLSTIFKKEEHISTKGYLTKVRMEKALEFIKSGRFKIKEVSEMVGYKNQLHFSNEFKKYYGKSPLNYFKEGVE